MPPQTFDSDSDAEPIKGRAAVDDEEMDEDVEADEDEEGGEGEDEYVVEAIRDHRFEGKVSFANPQYTDTHPIFNFRFSSDERIRAMGLILGLGPSCGWR